MNFNEFKKIIRSKLKDDKRFRIAYEDKKYIWIGTKNGLIGDDSCHYEFYMEDNKIYADAHFEDENNYELFKNVGEKDHIKWNLDAIRINESGNDINSDTVVEECLQNLRDLDETYGEELERIIKKIRAKPYTDLLTHTHNLILHGAPGTGKTHLAHEIAKAMGCSDNEIGFVQFHPSYDYTDFVEGLRPVNDGGSGQIGFERKDGVFKKFCERALKNLKDSNKTVDDLLENFKRDLKDKKEIIVQSIRSSTEFSVFLDNDKIKVRISNGTIYPTSVGKIQRYLESQEYDELHDTYDPAIGNYILNNYLVRSDIPFVFIIDEINRGEMSKIFGELFFAIEPSYRGAEKCKDLRTQYSNLQNEPNAFDEILKITDSDNFGHFFIPENVYIIGTMNDIDRNVESMDFAFRRRFTFREITAKDTQEQILSGLDDSIREEATNRMNSLNDAISKIEGLSSSYHIGGAYFLKLKDLDNDFGKLWEYHLEGLLREYLRGMENAEDELKRLEEAYKNDNLMEEKQNLHE